MLNVCILHYLQLLNKLKAIENALLTIAAISVACKALYNKLNTYYNLVTNQGLSHLSIATICDLRFNLSIYKFYIPNSIDTIKRDRARAQFVACYNQYKDCKNNIQVATIKATIAAKTKQLTPLEELDSDNKIYQHYRPSIKEVEQQQWFKENSVNCYTNILKYQQAKQYQYLVILQIAQDYLAILALLAALECIFSVSSDIVTRKRNRLLPSTLQYLLCLQDQRVIGNKEEDNSKQTIIIFYYYITYFTSKGIIQAKGLLKH